MRGMERTSRGEIGRSPTKTGPKSQRYVPVHDQCCLATWWSESTHRFFPDRKDTEKDRRGTEGRGGKTNQRKIVTDPSGRPNLSFSGSLCLTSTETMLMKTSECNHLIFSKYAECSTGLVWQCRALRQICFAELHGLCTAFSVWLNLQTFIAMLTTADNSIQQSIYCQALETIPKRVKPL